MQSQVLLAMAVKAMNDTLGPEGTVPSAPAFGEFPSLRSFTSSLVPRPTLAERAQAALKARRYMSQHLVETKVWRALKHNIPPATDRSYHPEDKVLVWREKVIENRIGEWTGPYTVVSHDATTKIVLVQKDAKAQPERYNVAQVEPFLSPQDFSTQFMATVHTALNKYSSNPTIQPIHMIEVIEPSDPRAMSREMQQAMMNEVRDHLQRGTFKVLLREELPDGSNALTARFVLSIKSNSDGKIKCKARYVVGGHRDRLRHYMVHGAQAL